MEKRNYLKPTIEFYGINSTTSFMAVSDIIIEEGTDTDENVVASLLDECFRVRGTLVNNSVVLGYMDKDNKTGKYTGCFESQNYETGNSSVITCKDERFKNLPRLTKVKVTYDPNVEIFTFSFDGCN